MAFQVTLGIFTPAFFVVKVTQKVHTNMKKRICLFLLVLQNDAICSLPKKAK